MWAHPPVTYFEPIDCLVVRDFYHRYTVDEHSLRAIKTLQELKAHGVEPSWGPNPGATFDGLRAEIKDPHGNSIELREWRNNDRADNAQWQPARPGLVRID